MAIDFGSPEQRTPCVLVLDVSGSMAEPSANGTPRIEELNRGLITFFDELHNHETACYRAQVAIVIVGGPNKDAEVIMDFTDAVDAKPIQLSTHGLTPLAAGIDLAASLIHDAKQKMKGNGIPYTMPWLFVMTDGLPTDEPEDWMRTANACKKAQADKHYALFAIGIGAEAAALKKLEDITHSMPPQALDTAKFKDFFVWLSASMTMASVAKPGDAIQAPTITWAMPT